MLLNVLPASELQGLSRRRKRPDDFKSVRHGLVAAEEAAGWILVKKNKSTTRLRRPKSHDVLLEDRVWSVLYRMGFTHMSADGGAYIYTSDSAEGPKTQQDVVALDDEVAIAIECKSVSKPKRLPNFAEILGKHISTRDQFTKDIRKEFQSEIKRQVKYAMFTSNVIVRENDIARAAEQGVLMFDDTDLDYYESLVSQIGRAARFQLLADLLRDRRIPGLELTVPAVKTKMGGYDCYTFTVSPDYLLKIAYVSHRTKGKASDVDTYQRMLKKSRLKRIREYITDGGIFPTNIVVNLRTRSFVFQRAKQEGEGRRDSTFGWLKLKPSYKAAWIIDGQHRLFAYADHPLASKSVVSVLAFNGLPPGDQARLFIDINAEQKKVNPSLLQELYAELHWDAEDPEIRVRAVLSKAIQALDTQTASPLRDRVLKADERRTDQRCISLTSLFSALGKRGFFILRTQKGQVVEYGPLWATTNEATLRRTIHVLSTWFDCIKTEADELWDLGGAMGGGLAMNDGVTVCINVLRSVFEHLETRGLKLLQLDDDELAEVITALGRTVGRYFASLRSEDMEQFRALRGIQGQTTGTRRVQEAINQKHPEFSPPELKRFHEDEKAQTNVKAYEIIARVEKTLQGTVIDELKREYGTDESGWWFMGVPVTVRKKVTERIEDAKGATGGKEENFDFIDYRTIISTPDNWPLFKDLLGQGGGKDKATKWMVEVNEIRKIVMHASRGRLPASAEQLAYLQDKEEWLISTTSGQNL